MTDSGSMDPATQVIREEEKRMETSTYLCRDCGQPGEYDCGLEIDQALTAAREESKERLAQLLYDPFITPWKDASPETRGYWLAHADFLLAHADVLADILRQSREIK